MDQQVGSGVGVGQALVGQRNQRRDAAKHHHHHHRHSQRRRWREGSLSANALLRILRQTSFAGRHCNNSLPRPCRLPDTKRACLLLPAAAVAFPQQLLEQMLRSFLPDHHTCCRAKSRTVSVVASQAPPCRVAAEKEGHGGNSSGARLRRATSEALWSQKITPLPSSAPEGHPAEGAVGVRVLARVHRRVVALPLPDVRLQPRNTRAWRTQSSAAWSPAASLRRFGPAPRAPKFRGSARACCGRAIFMSMSSSDSRQWAR